MDITFPTWFAVFMTAFVIPILSQILGKNYKSSKVRFILVAVLSALTGLLWLYLSNETVNSLRSAISFIINGAVASYILWWKTFFNKSKVARKLGLGRDETLR